MMDVLAYQRGKLVPDSYKTGNGYLSGTARLDGLHDRLDDVLLGKNARYDLDSIDSSLETDSSHDEYDHAHEGKEAHGHGGQCCPHGAGTVTAQHSSGQHSHGDTATGSSSDGHEHVPQPGSIVSSALTSGEEHYKGPIDGALLPGYDENSKAVTYKIISGMPGVLYVLNPINKSADYSDRRFVDRTRTATPSHEEHTHMGTASSPIPLTVIIQALSAKKQGWAIEQDTAEC